MFFSSSYGIDNITPEELRAKISGGEDFLLLDVRTPGENVVESIRGSCLIPVNEVGSRAGELPKDREIVVYCRIGNRSAFAALYLATSRRSHGSSWTKSSSRGTASSLPP